MTDCIPLCGKRGQLLKRSGYAWRKLKQIVESYWGQKPVGMIMRHLCENDEMFRNGWMCCNPEHVVWGTYKENSQDQIKAGRQIWQTKPEIHRNAVKKNMKYASSLRANCEYCGREGQAGWINGWHKKHCSSR